MKQCIICRLYKEEFNDEHVIPDAIQGYYHINSVCTDCNSRLGVNVDSKLVNHKFIEFRRSLLNIKGKGKYAPNPFSGTHFLKDDPSQKVRLTINNEGVFEPYLLPQVPTLYEMPNSFTIVLDKKDAAQKDTIIDKFIERNGIPKNAVVTTTKLFEAEYPAIQIQFKFDLYKFKLGILKIAYEFSVDQIPAYFDDPTALIISKILHDADFDSLSKINTYGDGITAKVLEPFAYMLNLENDNHYLILFDSEEFGLLCFVNLFNAINIAFQMTSKSGFIKDSLVVGINDLTKRTWRVLNASQIVNEIYPETNYSFKYHLLSEEQFLSFTKDESSQDFEFYRENEKIPFFDANGRVVYNDIEQKLIESQVEKHHRGDTVNVMITEFILDEELFIKLMPSQNLYKVIEVKSERRRQTKI